jgi:hypothetical protein
VNRTPYLVAGAVLAALFAWQSCQLLVREPAHLTAPPQEDYYPLKQGLTWVYRSATGMQVVRRVSYEPVDGWTQMQFDLPLLGRKTLLMVRTPEGVVARQMDRRQLIMKFPMNPGDSWTIDFPGEDLAECTVLTPEEIDVLSNRRMASKLRVVRTNRKTGKKLTDYEWYVRGIGLARMQVTFGLTATFELERFEHAK